MIGLWIVQAFAVGNQDPKPRAQLEELMPIAVVTGETGRIQAHHKAGLAKADLSDQRLKAVPILARRPGLAKIIIDDMNPLTWPARTQRLARPAEILQLRAFLMMTDLPGLR